MKRNPMGLTMAAVLLLAATPGSAHHGTSVTYDTSKAITVTGTVTEWTFGFPHSQIYFDVKDESGKVAKWGTELAPTPSMMRNLNIGWSRTSIRPGDKITLTCNPHRVPGATACLANKIVINDKLMPTNAGQLKETPGATASR